MLNVPLIQRTPSKATGNVLHRLMQHESALNLTASAHPTEALLEPGLGGNSRSPWWVKGCRSGMEKIKTQLTRRQPSKSFVMISHAGREPRGVVG